MTKSEFIATLANSTEYLSYKDATAIVNIFFESISEALVDDDKVELRGFGSFRIKTRGSRTGRNPKTGQSVKVESKRVPYFKPGKELKHLFD